MIAPPQGKRYASINIPSITDLEFPGLKFAIRLGEVKDVSNDPEAAFI